MGSFKDGLKTIVDHECDSSADGTVVGGYCLVGTLVGEKHEDLQGKLLDGISATSELQGCLPPDEPSYLLIRSGKERLLILSWLPDTCPAKVRMKFSTFK